MNKIPQSAFEVYRACGDPSHNYALNGVRIECGNGEGMAVGTNGKILAVLGWSHEGEPQKTLHSNDVCQRIADGDSPSAALPEIEGRFPRWRDVFPKRSDGELTACLDVRLLRRALTILERHIGYDDMGMVALTVVPDSSAPVLVTAHNPYNSHRGAVLVMPLEAKRERAWNPPPEQKMPAPTSTKPQESAKCWSRLVQGL